MLVFLPWRLFGWLDKIIFPEFHSGDTFSTYYDAWLVLSFYYPPPDQLYVFVGSKMCGHLTCPPFILKLFIGHGHGVLRIKEGE